MNNILDSVEFEGLVHMAMADDGTIVALFQISEDARKFCHEKDLCYVPFNTMNRYREPVPAIGTRYVA